MRIVKADQIFDGEKFINENTVVINNGIIQDVLYLSEDNIRSYEKIENYEGILIPGFINAHCHLELSYLNEQFTANTGITGFLKQIFEKRYVFDKETIIQSAIEWDKKMYEKGIVAVGDIVNSEDTLEVKHNSKIEYTNFIEIFGLKEQKAEEIFNNALNLLKKFTTSKMNAYMVAHSPYSLSEKLWHLFFNINENLWNIQSFHFLESESEKKLIQGKRSDLADYFQQTLKFNAIELRHISKNFYIYLKKLLEKSKNILLVHNTFLDYKYLELLNHYKEKIFFCLCPNANLFIEGVLPNIELLKTFSENICIGTDSLASNKDLNMVSEINTLLQYFDMEPKEVLKWATSKGAKFLNIDNQFGYIKKNYKVPINLVTINYIKQKPLLQFLHVIY